jgi:hypothetical protein
MQSTLTRAVALLSLVAASLGCSSILRADDPARPDDPVRQKRLELFTSRVQQFEIEVAGDAKRKLMPGKQPILRWSNPVRDNLNDGVIFLFFEGERPRGVVTVWADSPQADLAHGKLWREFVSLSGEPLVCQREGAELWSPRTGGVVDQPFKDAPPPAAKPAQRLTQMRDLARRFVAANYKMDVRNELRLLTQPLYRYAKEDGDILDGALFAFVEGNDPEVLLLLEAVSANGGKSHSWHFSMARMTGYRVSANLDGREVFSALPYWKNPRAVTDPYVEAPDGEFTLEK